MTTLIADPLVADVPVTLRPRHPGISTEVDATPEQSDGNCYFDAPNIDATARRHRSILAEVLTGAGLVNYPTEWWHWSFGDRYWAFGTGSEHAIYGPVSA